MEQIQAAGVRHLTYMRVKPNIDCSHEDFSLVLRDELKSLKVKGCHGPSDASAMRNRGQIMTSMRF